MKVEVGDVISFKLTRDTCWGPKGKHRAVVLEENKDIIVQYLDLKLIKSRIGNLTAMQGYDILNAFLNCSYVEDIKVLKNISN